MLRISSRVVLCTALINIFGCSVKAATYQGKSGHESSKIISDHIHFEGDHHDKKYDHDAFLGPDHARKFDHLPPDQSKARLGQIVDQIDSNEDGYVTLDEMRDWIKSSHERYIFADVDRQWAYYNMNYRQKEKIDWSHYRKQVFGFLDSDVRPGEEVDEDTLKYIKMESREKRRWDAADEDQDGYLTELEFKYFLHPDMGDHTKEGIIIETIESIDTNEDGVISLEEYISDLYTGDEKTEPDWVKDEREAFHQHRDENGDGVLDSAEVRKWIQPHDYDPFEAEARHLIYESDADKDTRLTKQEILAKYDLFVGSQATDFGEAILSHDEF